MEEHKLNIKLVVTNEKNIFDIEFMLTYPFFTNTTVWICKPYE